MMRLMDSTAEFVCRVEKVRWPVSATRRRGLDRLEVAHLADEDDVRVLAEDRAQGVAVGLGVGEELALVDDGLPRRQVVFDGVLDGDDMDAPLAR